MIRTSSSFSVEHGDVPARQSTAERAPQLMLSRILLNQLSANGARGKHARMSDETDIKRSRKHEMRVYLNSMKAMYENALLQNGEVYDIAAALTQDFNSITSRAILTDSRIIKILRYAIAPSISQMKFGQFFGMSSIGTFENDKVSPGTAKYQTLKAIASKMALFAKERIDTQRFLWLDPEGESVSDLDLARAYAKSWTC